MSCCTPTPDTSESEKSRDAKQDVCSAPPDSGSEQRRRGDAKKNVGKFVTARAPNFNKPQQLSTKYSLTSGSGPGGRRFKSTLSDQSIPSSGHHLTINVTGILTGCTLE